ncbi:hypothetical protein LCGC14_2584130, partial [marine sediment metagenome]
MLTPREEQDATRLSDIRYYRESAIAKRLTEQATRRARRARREAIVLLPLVAAILLMWHYHEDLFGSDVPVRIAAAVALTVVGWRFTLDLGRALGPRLLARLDPSRASTVGFLVQLVTLLLVAILALRIVDLEPRALALGGAFTAVVLGLAAQTTLVNLIAGMVLHGARPFRVGERVRLRAGALGGQVEGTVAGLGLLYTRLARGEDVIMIPNNLVLAATVMPVRQPAGVDLRARLRPDVKPSDLQRLLGEGVTVPTRDEPHISLEEVYGDEVLVRLSGESYRGKDEAAIVEVLAHNTHQLVGRYCIENGITYVRP